MIAPWARAGLLALGVLSAAAPAGAVTLAAELPARAPRQEAAMPLSLLALLIALAAIAPLVGDRLALRRRPLLAPAPGARAVATAGPAAAADAPLSVTVLPTMRVPATGIELVLRGRLLSLRSHAQGDDLQRRLLIAEAHLDFGHSGVVAGLLDAIEHDCCVSPPLNGAARPA